MQNTETQQKRKKHSQFREVWKRFKRNPIAMTGLVIIVLVASLIPLAPVIAPGTDFDPGYDVQNLRYRFLPPSLQRHVIYDENGNQIGGSGRIHIFGTDNFGRDVFGRIAHGASTTLSVGFIVLAIALTIGVVLGAISGFYSGMTDNIIMRFIDIILAVPNILMALALGAVMGPGLTTIMIAVGIGAIPGYARIVRASVLSLREQEFVEAARSIGANDFRIIRRHILPNCIAPIIIEATMGLAGAILAAAALSFLGLGMTPPSPEWGAMLSLGRDFMLAGEWHMTFFPGLFIALMVFALNMVGDGLRDAFDPRLRTANISKKKFLRQTAQMRRDLAGGE
ncbi:MAG: ABC transporter permease [Defluviitaleaceae bacterium]|nr:ABC transporter permease [Defluviitaleaceae bacterium]